MKQCRLNYDVYDAWALNMGHCLARREELSYLYRAITEYCQEAASKKRSWEWFEKERSSFQRRLGRDPERVFELWCLQLFQRSCPCEWQGHVFFIFLFFWGKFGLSYACCLGWILLHAMQCIWWNAMYLDMLIMANAFGFGLLMAHRERPNRKRILSKKKMSSGLCQTINCQVDYKKKCQVGEKVLPK